MAGHIKYRTEIDGLRAIAVLAVALYHADPSIVRGGFVGVDIFFVISGFLITGIIYRQLQSSSFTFSDFYWRRFRRILPALTFMLAVVTLVCYRIFDPNLFTDYGNSLWSASLFSSNIFFWTEVGYFQTSSALKPLLHTWSLGVEEQYYIIFPVILMLVFKWVPKKVFWVLCGIGIISFALSVWGVTNKPIATFYLLPTRLWELLLGSLLAVANPQPFKSLGLNKGAQWIGMVLMVGPIFIYTDTTIFPGASALLPCIGTALLIWTTVDRPSIITAILSWRPITFVGNASYSFYLWHWPILVLAEYYTFDDLTTNERLLLLVLAFAVSVFSWRVVERPFRENHILFPKNRMLKISALNIIVFVAIGGMITGMRGVPSRFEPGLSLIIAGNSDISEYSGRGCNNIGYASDHNTDFCELGSEKSDNETFLLWGNSHAMPWSSPVAKLAQENNIRGVLAVWDVCSIFLGMDSKIEGQPHDCLGDRQSVRELLENNSDLKTVILSSRWGAEYHGSMYGEEEAISGLTRKYKGQPIIDSPAVFKMALDETLAWLTGIGKTVVIIGPVPEIGYDVPRALLASSLGNFDDDIRPTIDEFMDRQDEPIKALEEAALKYGATILYPHEKLCETGVCAIIHDGHPLYFDDDHLSRYGALYLSGIPEQAMGLKGIQ